MCEIIEKLAEQAMAKAVAKNFTGEKLELRMPSEAWAKEFAELIVDECCLKLVDMHEGTKGNHNFYMHAALEIKRHFRGK